MRSDIAKILIWEALRAHNCKVSRFIRTVVRWNARFLMLSILFFPPDKAFVSHWYSLGLWFGNIMLGLVVVPVLLTLYFDFSNVKRGISDRSNAEFLFYLFLDAKNCDALVGDLEERYKLIRKKFGARRANFWYWAQTIRSVGPIFWAAMKRVTKAATGIAALVEMYRRIRL